MCLYAHLKNLMSFKLNFLFIVLFCSTINACEPSNEERYIFFLHNRFLEGQDLDDLYPEYGQTEYRGILKEFEESGFKVISEKRTGNVNARDYAFGVVA